MTKVLSNFEHLVRIILLLLVAFSASFCNGQNRSSHVPSDDPLLAELAEIHGKYVWHDELKRYVFSEKRTVEKILSGRNPEQLIRVLVECLDRTEQTLSTIDDKRVMLGSICYEALSQTVYHEQYTAEGDVASAWPGHLRADASENDLRAAKRAWKKVLDLKTYHFL